MSLEEAQNQMVPQGWLKSQTLIVCLFTAVLGMSTELDLRNCPERLFLTLRDAGSSLLFQQDGKLQTRRAIEGIKKPFWGEDNGVKI